MKIKFLVMPALAAVLLAACNNETINQSSDKNFPSDGKVAVTTSINNSASSFSSTKKTLRDGTPSQFDGNSLTLTINYKGEWSTIQDNIKWTKDDANNWTPATQMKWKDNTTPCSVYAFSPYGANYQSNGEVYFDTKLDQRKGVAGSDFAVYSQVDKSPSEILKGGILPINFSHKMSQLTLNIKLKTAQKNNPISKVELLNANYQLNMNCETGEVSGSGPGTFIMDSLKGSGDYDQCFKVIFAPTEWTANTRILKLTDSNDKVYYYNAGLKGLKFESGKSYTLNLGLGEDSVSIEPSNLTINDWDNGGDMSDDGGDVATLEVGDFINTDGTTSKQYVMGKSVGLVYWIGNPSEQDTKLEHTYNTCTHGLAIALQNAPLSIWQESKDSLVDKWIEDHLSTGYPNFTEKTNLNLDYTKGYNNTAALKAYNDAHKDSPLVVKAVEALKTWTTPKPSNASAWYLPSYGDIKNLVSPTESGYRPLTRINAQLKKLINNGINADLISGYSWTSTEASASDAFYFYDSSTSYNYKTANYNLRFIVAF